MAEAQAAAATGATVSADIRGGGNSDEKREIGHQVSVVAVSSS